MVDKNLGEFEELVLLVVAANHKEAYGVLVQEILQEELQKRINVAAIHVVLKRMEVKGYLTSSYGGITKSRGGRRKKYYTITALGKQLLDKQFNIRTRFYGKIPKISFG